MVPQEMFPSQLGGHIRRGLSNEGHGTCVGGLHQRTLHRASQYPIPNKQIDTENNIHCNNYTKAL